MSLSVRNQKQATVYSYKEFCSYKYDFVIIGRMKINALLKDPTVIEKALLCL